ncbi:small-conductance mechanosensitive channel protein [Sulfuricella denitrificans skB26]|uniref:Small-conductance mechanosensitive channel protein n=1 Tax=Sulfuricella denitrificans (strain DSM 22764 / NBRC 105220 / skB26) TaxID=1163617 RepID=S6A9L9_SULDS|nr:mechanosensitive ion channel family protein [Sulfuricella denitrificans]BAN34340.1 small-conductance mechanosensitive channel protein [Sulfuricella denitrificans skB26]
MDMKVLSDKLGLSFLAEPWLLQVFLVVLATVLVSAVAQFLLRRAERMVSQTASHWDDGLIQAAKRPLPIIIWLVGIAFAAGTVGKETGAAIFDAVPPIRNVGVVVCLAWFLIRLIRNVSCSIVVMREEKGEEVDLTTIDALSKLARLTVIIIATLMAMQTLDFSISGVLAAGGIGGIAIGFAAKDLLANFFGGLTVYLDRPFSVGDWIRSPDKKIEGTVEYISWRHTRVRAFNKNPIYVPNALFTTIVVENPSRMTNRRIKETVGIRYEDIGVMGAIVADVKVMLQNHVEIDATQTLIVNFNTFGPSSLDFFIYTFTKTTAWVHFHEVKQDVLLKVAEIIDRHGAQIAFPTRTVHIEAATPLLEDH